VWNGVIDRHPAAILQCVDPQDVVAGVKAARAHDLPLTVKSGGHMTTGHAVCDDGLVLDLSPMNRVEVRSDGRTVKVAGGATWADVNAQALPSGLLPPGIPLDVGVGGFTLGGGLGVTARVEGLAIDNLQAVDLVTADGRLITATEDEHSDLFWALRGGGGGFGIVTSFTFNCRRGGRALLVGQAMYPVDAAGAYLRYFREQMAQLPDALYPVVSFITIPDLPGLPENLPGTPALSVYVMGVGDPADVAATLQDFMAFGDPLLASTDVVDYADLFAPFVIPKGERHHWESVFLNKLSDELIDTLLAEVLPLPTPGTAVNFYGLGGAIDEVGADETAYAHRGSRLLFHITTHWTEASDDEANVAWTRDLHSIVRPFGNGGEYLNNQTDNTPERVRAAFGKHYDRLIRIKQTWDPEDVFRSPHLSR
jgi:FAD/FMN-containing dehydrogenase